MSICLDEARVQAAADGEATPGEMDHVRTCSTCRARVADARAAIHEFGQQMSAIQVPDRLRHRIATGVAPPIAGDRSGATTLRRQPQVLRPAWLFAGGAVAASVVALLFIVFPSIDPGTQLNAAEILNRSLQTLEGTGIEHLEYELSLDTGGAAPVESQTALGVGSGTYRIDQLVDHTTGRWRFARFAADGTLLNGIAENPAAGMRETLIRVDDRTFHLRFAITPDEVVPLWDLQRRYAEAMIRIVQASGGQVVTEQEVGGRKQYVVELPAPPSGTGSAMLDMHHARVVVDAADFHIVEFVARGAVLGEDISIGYRLLRRAVAASVGPGTQFELPVADANIISLQGEGSTDIPADLLSLLLREVSRGK